jgi:NAD+ synthase (glutamine-hydrolysing)
MPLTIAVAQLNFIVGDMAGNARMIVQAAHEVHARGARLMLTPELAVCGYAAEDLYLRPSFVAACEAAVDGIAQSLAGLQDMVVVVGHPAAVDITADGTAGAAAPARLRSVSQAPCYNAATVLSQGRRLQRYVKRELPNYQVFDERRYFAPGSADCVFEVMGVRVGLLICEDAWFDEPVASTRRAGAQVLAVINASPFHVGKGQERVERMAQRCRKVGLPLVYCHLVGGQDEVVFDGNSFCLGADGRLVGRAASFREQLFMVSVLGAADGAGPVSLNAELALPADADAELWDALVVGVRDYIGKNGFPGAFIGLSGGVDSALVLAIAVDALGRERVRAVMMPSPYTADISWIDAREMARRLGVRYDEISILPEFEAFKASLRPQFEGRAEDATEENIQARIRGTLLMALSNKLGSIVLTTGNKSEMATGYCTLYGDMAGGFAVIKDLVKTTVFRLARWRNANDPYGSGAQPIPQRIITRPPSAELRPDQTDQDSLPPYEVLDAILEQYMENDASVEDIVAGGLDAALVERVAKLIKINEYKRRQAPVGIRVTHRSFGKDWRYPITSKFRA